MLEISINHNERRIKVIKKLIPKFINEKKIKTNSLTNVNMCINFQLVCTSTAEE